MDRVTADAQALFERGHQSFESRDFREAVECFSRAIKLRPDVAAGYRYRAMAYLELGQRTDALNDLDRAIRLKPDDPALYADRADVLFRQKSYEAAISDCDRVLTLDTGWAPIRGLRGECYAAVGDTPKALADFAEAIQTDPDHATGYLLARANLFLETEQYDECVNDANAVLRIDPENAAGYQVRGLAQREQRHLEAAEVDLSEAARLDPKAELVRLARATVRIDLGRYDSAIEDCDFVLERRPEHPRALTLRGICRRHLHDLEGAVTDLSTAIQLNPADQLPYNLRAAVYYHLHQYARAVQDHLEALKRNPRDPGTFNQLGWLWATAPDPDVRNGPRAKECATRACELTEWQEAGFLDTLAAAHAECGEFEEAIQWQRKALKLAGPEADEVFTERLELYERGKPVRVTPSD